MNWDWPAWRNMEGQKFEWDDGFFIIDSSNWTPRWRKRNQEILVAKANLELRKLLEKRLSQ